MSDAPGKELWDAVQTIDQPFPAEAMAVRRAMIYIHSMERKLVAKEIEITELKKKLEEYAKKETVNILELANNE